jgi:hypothetical protein
MIRYLRKKISLYFSLIRESTLSYESISSIYCLNSLNSKVKKSTSNIDTLNIYTERSFYNRSVIENTMNCYIENYISKN